MSYTICSRFKGEHIVYAGYTICTSREHIVYGAFCGSTNAPLHNMLLLVAYCVPCIHNMLRWSILCTLHTQYATSGAYCVGSIHMLFQWSSEGTQYALLENMSRGICLSF